MTESTQICPPITSAQFVALADIVRERTGLVLPREYRHRIQGRLLKRLGELGIDTFDHYVTLLTSGPFQRDEFQELLALTGIDDTSFYAPGPQLTEFAAHVLPDLMAARASARCVRIWSVFCGSGEPAYTLAMMVHRALGLRARDWRIEILGTTQIDAAIETACAGVYSDHALRWIPPMEIDRFFRRAPGGRMIHPDISASVFFKAHSFAHRRSMSRSGPWDAVLLGPAFAYLDQRHAATAFASFLDLLAPDGTLLVDSRAVVPPPEMFRPVAGSRHTLFRSTRSVSNPSSSHSESARG